MTDYLVTINDNKNNKNYARLIDCIRPQDDGSYAYICITKFQASIVTINLAKPNNIVVCVESSQSSYTNDPVSSIAVNSSIIDSFASNTFIQLGGVERAIYNVENNISNWIKINRSSLSNLKFSFKICNQYALNLAGSDDNISYEFLDNFPFTLQFKIKF